MFVLPFLPNNVTNGFAQDLPEVFEDNLQQWMDGFLLLLRMPEDAAVAATSVA